MSSVPSGSFQGYLDENIEFDNYYDFEAYYNDGHGHHDQGFEETPANNLDTASPQPEQVGAAPAEPSQNSSLGRVLPGNDQADAAQLGLRAPNPDQSEWVFFFSAALTGRMLL
jgi:hypothetical protein